MKIIKFSEKINEVLIHPDFNVKEDVETYGIISFDKYIYLFDEDNDEQIKEIINIINTEFDVDIPDDGDADFLYRLLDEEYPNILSFKYTVGDDNLYFSFSNDFSQNPESSKQIIDVLKTLKKEFDVTFLSVTDNTGEEDTYSINALISDWNEGIKYRKLPSYVYHGTCLKYIQKILKIGLRPDISKSNYDKIVHKNKLFFAANKNNAAQHADNAALKNNSIPIVLKIDTKVFDIDKIDIDYDFYKTYMNDDTHSDYSKIETNFSGSSELLIKLKNKYIGATYNKFAYAGVIPPKYIVTLITKFDQDDETPNQEFYPREYKEFLEMIDFYEGADMLYPDNYNLRLYDFQLMKDDMEEEEVQEEEYEEELEEVQEKKIIKFNNYDSTK